MWDGQDKKQLKFNLETRSVWGDPAPNIWRIVVWEGIADMFWEIPENKLKANRDVGVAYIWTRVTSEDGGISHRCPKGEWLTGTAVVSPHSWGCQFPLTCLTTSLPTSLIPLPQSFWSQPCNGFYYKYFMTVRCLGRRKTSLRGTALDHWKALC